MLKPIVGRIPSNQVETARTPSREACPFLGLSEDPTTIALYPRGDHTCQRVLKRSLSSRWQERYCLGPNHVECPYFAREPSESWWSRCRSWQSLHTSKLLAASSIFIAMIAGFISVLTMTGVLGIAAPLLSPSDDEEQVVVSQPTGVVPTATAVETSDDPRTVEEDGASSNAVGSDEIAVASQDRGETREEPRTLRGMGGAPAQESEPTPTATATPEPEPTPTPEPDRYVVQPGDTLLELAVEFGTTLEELMAWNDIDDQNRIHVGQELIVSQP